MQICVVGAGAIGGLVAARLLKSGHEVTVIARGETLHTIQRDGLTVRETDDSILSAKPTHCSDNFVIPTQPDIVFLAMKAHQILGIADQLPNLWTSETTIVPMQNGIPWWYFHKEGGRYDGQRLNSLDPNGIIEEIIPSDQIVGSIVFPAATRDSPGVIRHIEGDRLPVGEPDGSKSDRARLLAETLSHAGFRSRVLSDIRSHIWLKAWGNLAFNPISALTGSTLREICEDSETRQLCASIMEEALAIALALGIKIRISIDQRIAGAEEVGHHKTSMLQDAEAGRRMEIDPLVRVFVELGEMTGVATPLISAVCTMVSLLDEQIAKAEK